LTDPLSWRHFYDYLLHYNTQMIGGGKFCTSHSPLMRSPVEFASSPTENSIGRGEEKEEEEAEPTKPE
jgi:hypothetical protein